MTDLEVLNFIKSHLICIAEDKYNDAIVIGMYINGETLRAVIQKKYISNFEHDNKQMFIREPDGWPLSHYEWGSIGRDNQAGRLFPTKDTTDLIQLTKWWDNQSKK